MERERQSAHCSVAKERARAVAAERDAESASSQADARKRQLQHDLDDAHSEAWPTPLLISMQLFISCTSCLPFAWLVICVCLQITVKCHFGIISLLLLTLMILRSYWNSLHCLWADLCICKGHSAKAFALPH